MPLGLPFLLVVTEPSSRSANSAHVSAMVGFFRFSPLPRRFEPVNAITRPKPPDRRP